MSDQVEAYQDHREASREKRAGNRESSAQILTDKGIEFERKNMGAHLIVSGSDCLIDFWPGTGKFIARNGNKGRGVFNLIKLCNQGESNG